MRPSRLERLLRQAIGTLLLLSLSGWLLLSHRTARPAVATRHFPALPRADLTVAGRHFCLPVARTPAQHRLAALDANLSGAPPVVVFYFAPPASGLFLLSSPGAAAPALTVTWFGAGGRFLASTKMGPCLGLQGFACPLHSPPERYQLVIEVSQPGAGMAGMAPSSEATLGGGCRPQAGSAAVARAEEPTTRSKQSSREGMSSKR